MIHCYNKKTERTLFLEKKVEVGCMRKQVYSLLVDNTPGVLSRIAGLFSRRGFSIDSITAGVTADPRFTRITVVASGDERILSQIEKQVRKLEDVLEIKLLNDEEAVYRELILVKIKADATLRPGIIAIADVFRAKIIDVEKESLIIELTGAQSKLDAFLNLLDGYEILELARTGITGLSRGNKDIADDSVVDLRNLVRDYYYFKDLQSAVALKLTAELKVSFPAYAKVFSKVTTQSSLKLLSSYPLPADMLAASKEDIVDIIRSTARFGEAYALRKYDAIIAAAQDAAVFGRALPSNAVRIRLYIDTYQEYQKHLDALLKALHETIEKLQDTLIYDQICLLQSLRGIGFLSAVVLIAEMGNFKLFSSPKKLYAYFGLDPAVKQSGKLNGDKVHMSKRGSSLARRVLHMAALNNVKVDKGSGTPVNPVVYDYYTRKCSGKKKPVAMGAVMHKICNIIFAMLRDNKPFEIITPEEHCRRFATEHPDKIRKAA